MMVRTSRGIFGDQFVSVQDVIAFLRADANTWYAEAVKEKDPTKKAALEAIAQNSINMAEAFEKIV